MNNAADYFFVFALGALFGMGELLQRHKLRVFRQREAWFYMGVNGPASPAALALLRGMQGQTADTESASFWGSSAGQILTAGLGAAALFRAKVTLPGVVGEKGSGEIGAAFILEGILNAIDDELIDANNAAKLEEIRELSADVDFERDQTFLPLTCLSITDLSPEAETAIGEQIGLLHELNLTEEQKGHMLIQVLFREVGYRVLKQVIAYRPESADA